MKLSFHSRAGHLVAWPGTKFIGQPPRYVGREFVKEPDQKKAKSSGMLGVLRATSEPAVIDTDTADPGDVAHLIRQCKKGGLLPADAATAAACGVEFAPVSQDQDGEWSLSAAVAPKPQPAPKKSAASES